jgi:protein-disulfide isomerase
MPDGNAPLHHIVKKIVLTVLAAALAVSVLADEKEAPAPPLGDRAEKLIKDGLPICAEPVKMTRVGLQHKLPINMTGNVIRIESDRPVCSGQWVAIVSREGGFFLGIPWFIDGEGTPEAKVKSFAWSNLQQNFDPVIDRKLTRESLNKITLNQTTERGKVPMTGEIDPAGGVLFFGPFYPINEDIRESRLKNFAPYIAQSPSTGAGAPTVTVIEFSDFECPSCQHASHYMQPILEKYGDKVRYVRFDLPLVTMHPWAFSAAVAGRAIWMQKPAAFWEYKEQVYKNQDKLSAFTFDDFARGFAADHDLDLKKYDADIANPEIQASILGGVGTAFSSDVRATPTYMVNGAIVDPGNEGKYLESYVAGLVKK